MKWLVVIGVLGLVGCITPPPEQLLIGDWHGTAQFEVIAYMDTLYEHDDPIFKKSRVFLKFGDRVAYISGFNGYNNQKFSYAWDDGVVQLSESGNVDSEMKDTLASKGDSDIGPPEEQGMMVSVTVLRENYHLKSPSFIIRQLDEDSLIGAYRIQKNSVTNYGQFNLRLGKPKLQ